MDLKAIRRNLAAAGARADGQLKPYPFLPDMADPPAVVVGQIAFERATMQALTNGGYLALSVDVTFVVGTAWDRSAQELVDDLAPLIWQEMEADPTLSGETKTLQVVSWEPQDQIEVAEFSMVGGVFRVEAIA